LARRAFSDGALDKTERAVISGSRLFNIVLGLPRHEENIIDLEVRCKAAPLQARTSATSVESLSSIVAVQGDTDLSIVITLLKFS
jgi:hypothetical protein